jgi:hypothetical protein
MKKSKNHYYRGGRSSNRKRILIELYIQNTIVDPLTECHFWQGAKDGHGYGSLSHGGKRYQAHRIFYIVFREEIINNNELHHHCDNGSLGCINPFHVKQMSKSMHSKLTWIKRKEK